MAEHIINSIRSERFKKIVDWSILSGGVLSLTIAILATTTNVVQADNEAATVAPAQISAH